MTFFVHHTAEVSPDAEIGNGTKIWNEAQIMPGASVGDDVIIGKGVFIDAGVGVGSRCKIQNYACLYRGAMIEDEVFVGPHVVCANDTYPRAANADGTIKSDKDWLVDGVTVRRGASLGTGVVALPGVEIGPFAMVAAGAVVSRDVAPHAIVTGLPARRVGFACICGHTLDKGLACPACGRHYIEGQAGLEIAESAGD